MNISYGKLRASIHLSNIVKNYQFLRRLNSGVIPVVKCEAYGHGLLPVSRALSAAGATILAVGSIDEAVKLRTKAPYAGKIISMLGICDTADAEAAVAYNIIPFIHQLEQLHTLRRVTGNKSFPLCLKFDTGMSRLGFNTDNVAELIAFLTENKHLQPMMMASHLASADNPEAKEEVLEQAACFKEMRQTLKQAGFTPKACLANSAALMAYPELHLDCQRAGIALYGANPFTGTTLEHLGDKLKPAMNVAAPILQIQHLPEGARVGYGGDFTCPSEMTVGIVAVGYADCYSRGLSNKACMLVGGKRVKILGRVCMQLTAVDLSGLEQVKVGDPAVLLGQQYGAAITAYELSAWWGTIPYEIFCLLGLNQRNYIT